MSGTVIPFRRPVAKAGAVVPPAKRAPGLAVVLEAQPGAVCLVYEETELWLTPQQARALVRDLSDMADFAEAATRG